MKRNPIIKSNTEDISTIPKNLQGHQISIPADRSLYSTNTSTSVNSSLNMSLLNSSRKPEEAEVVIRQKSDKVDPKAKELASLASLREKRREERSKQSGSASGPGMTIARLGTHC